MICRHSLIAAAPSPWLRSKVASQVARSPARSRRALRGSPQGLAGPPLGRRGAVKQHPTAIARQRSQRLNPQLDGSLDASAQVGAGRLHMKHSYHNINPGPAHWFSG
jgi:hypothetical protein